MAKFGKLYLEQSKWKESVSAPTSQNSQQWMTKLSLFLSMFLRSFSLRKKGSNASILAWRWPESLRSFSLVSNCLGAVTFGLLQVLNCMISQWVHVTVFVCKCHYCSEGFVTWEVNFRSENGVKRSKQKIYVLHFVFLKLKLNLVAVAKPVLILVLSSPVCCGISV